MKNKDRKMIHIALIISGLLFAKTRAFALCFVLLASGAQEASGVDINFDAHIPGALRSDTGAYDYTRNAVFDAANKLPDTLAFNAGSSTDYLIQSRGPGHESCLFLTGGNNPAADHEGIYLMNMDMTADGANLSRTVRVEWSFDILGASNDADFDPTGWTVALNFANTDSDLDITDGGFSTNLTGRVVAQTFDFINAGFSGTSGWTTVTGYYEIPEGEAGNLGAIQIRTRNGGWISSNTGMYCLDNITVNAFPLPDTGFPQKNFVKNPGFDALYRDVSGGQIPIYWSRAYGSESQIQTSTSELKEGYRSLLLEDTGSNSIGAVTDLIEASPGFNYTACVDIKCVDTPSAGSMVLRFYDSSENIISSTSTSSLASDWVSLSITEMAPTNATHVELLCYVSSGAETGQIYFDNASLVYADEMLANGSWIGCPTNALPANWIQWAEVNPAFVEQYDGNNVILIDDNMTTQDQGVYTILPASPGVPYNFSARAQKIGGNSQMWLSFMDASTNVITSSTLSITAASWNTCDVKEIAPPDTCYARIMFYCPTTSTGSGVFKEVSLTEDYTSYYVSPDGTGDGLSYTNPAVYTSETLWSNVNSAAENHPAKVIFRTGNYNSSDLALGAIGNLRHAIVVEGERPFGTVFDGMCGIRLYGSQNMVLRNIHFASAPAQSTSLFVGAAGAETRNITVSDCYFINMTNLLWAGVSISEPETHDVTANNCIFVRVGNQTDSSHVFYNLRHSYGIKLIDNYFEDAWGSYVKIRSGSSGYQIIGNTFIQNNGYRTSSSKPFIHFTVYNLKEENDRDEVLGTDYLIENNLFEYNVHSQYPMWIWVEGMTPVNHPGYHEITSAERQVVENTANTASNRNDVIVQNFGIDILNDWVVGNNIYSNASSTTLRMSRQSSLGISEPIYADLSALIE